MSNLFPPNLACEEKDNTTTTPKNKSGRLLFIMMLFIACWITAGLTFFFAASVNSGIVICTLYTAPVGNRHNFLSYGAYSLALQNEAIRTFITIKIANRLTARASNA